MQITLRNQLLPKYTFTLHTQFIYYLTRRVTDTIASFRLVTFRARHEKKNEAQITYEVAVNIG